MICESENQPMGPSQLMARICFKAAFAYFEFVFQEEVGIETDDMAGVKLK